jgi:hypothetical protein
MSVANVHVWNGHVWNSAWNGARLIAVLALAFVSACAAGVTGEVTAAACSTPNIDEDNDDLIDCKDPDCHGFEHCRNVRDSGQSEPEAGGSGGMSGSGGAGGSGGGEPISGGMGGSSSDDAGDAEPVDAGGDADPLDAMEPEPPEPCGGSCGVGAECNVDTNMCVPTGSKGGSYTITVLSATAPRETPIAQCVDPCQGPAVWCPCPADPFVRVVRVRLTDADSPPDEEEIVQTATLRDNEAPTYTEAPTQLELIKGDVLRFELWQDLLLSDDAMVFECTPDLAEVKPGELVCTANSGPGGSDMFTIRARLDAAPQ